VVQECPDVRVRQHRRECASGDALAETTEVLRLDVVDGGVALGRSPAGIDRLDVDVDRSLFWCVVFTHLCSPFQVKGLQVL